MAVVRTAASVALCALLVAVSSASKTQEFKKVSPDTNRARKALLDCDVLAVPPNWGSYSPDLDYCNKVRAVRQKLCYQLLRLSYFPALQYYHVPPQALLHATGSFPLSLGASINGQYFPLELHLVHKAENGNGLLVLGILFKISTAPSENIQNLLNIAKRTS
eukprot:IDg1552t1